MCSNLLPYEWGRGGKSGTSRPGVHPHQFFCVFFIFVFLFFCKSLIISVLVRLLYDFSTKLIDNLLIINVSAPFEWFFCKSIFENWIWKKILRKNGSKGTRDLIHRELSYTMFPKNSTRNGTNWLDYVEMGGGREGWRVIAAVLWWHLVCDVKLYETNVAILY